MDLQEYVDEYNRLGRERCEREGLAPHLDIPAFALKAHFEAGLTPKEAVEEDAKRFQRSPY